MKILHIDTEKGWRGGQQQAAYLLETLYEKGYDTALICQPESAFETFCEDKNLPYFSINMKGEFDLIAAYQIARLCKKNHFDILHLHTAHAIAIGLLTKLFYSKIKLIAVRRVDFHVNKNWFSKFKYNNRLLDIIECVSDSVKNVLLEDGVPGQKLITIHDGVDLDRFRDVIPPPDLNTQFGIPPHNLVIGTIAALVGHKDCPNLLRAAKIVLDNVDNVAFCAVGDGPDKEKILSLADQLGLGDRFIFTGFQKEVGKFLKIFDIFVLASKLEGLGTSILDAQTIGLPVVACRTGGIPEIIIHNQNGLLVPPQNEKALADALLLLLHDKKLCAKLSLNAIMTVKKFDIKDTIEKNIQLYRELLS